MAKQTVRRPLPAKFDADWVLTRYWVTAVICGSRHGAAVEQLALLFIRRLKRTAWQLARDARIDLVVVYEASLTHDEFADEWRAGAAAWWKRYRAGREEGKVV